MSDVKLLRWVLITLAEEGWLVSSWALWPGPPKQLLVVWVDKVWLSFVYFVASDRTEMFSFEVGNDWIKKLKPMEGWSEGRLFFW